MIGSSSNGYLQFKLFEGPLDNYFVVNFVINIIDNNGGITYYKLPKGVQINLNANTSYLNIYQQIIGESTQSNFNKILNQLHYQTMPITVNSYISAVNRMSLLEYCQSKL